MKLRRSGTEVSGVRRKFVLALLAMALLYASALLPSAQAQQDGAGDDEIRPGPVVPGPIPAAVPQPKPPELKLPEVPPLPLNLNGLLAANERDLKVLVIAADGKETDYPAITTFLKQVGIPHDELIATQQPLTAATLSDGTRGHYQGIILTTGNLSYFNSASGVWESAFTADEWKTLYEYEAKYKVRQVTSFTFPCGPATKDPNQPEKLAQPDKYGLGFDCNAPAYQDTSVAPLQTKLTDAGKSVFPYLKPNSPITIKHAWTYLPKSPDPRTRPLLVVDNGSPDPPVIASTHSYPDGRENLAVTSANNPYLLHSILLSYGVLNWVTKGLFLGERHVNMGYQV
ncbi:MAG: hypothetical protein M3198_18545, partial [Actinomycetota bacterium]|nr:hypothetical protein [Actinomycetota bacterium]